MRILFVEDDELIASGLVYALTAEGYQVTHCKDAASGTSAARTGDITLGLLDISLPDGSGYQICRVLRERGIPVIFLTAVDDEGNVVQGLEMGADDYVTKPFRLRELLARIRGVIERSTGGHSPVIHLGGGVEIRTLEAAVYRDGAAVDLSPLEYRLLQKLAGHRGQVLSRDQLLEGIWDSSGSFVNDNTLTVCIKRLREKLGDDKQQPRIIQTVRGMGYRIHG